MKVPCSKRVYRLNVYLAHSTESIEDDVSNLPTWFVGLWISINFLSE